MSALDDFFAFAARPRAAMSGAEWNTIKSGARAELAYLRRENADMVSHMPKFRGVPILPGPNIGREPIAVSGGGISALIDRFICLHTRKPAEEWNYSTEEMLAVLEEAKAAAWLRAQIAAAHEATWDISDDRIEQARREFDPRTLCHRIRAMAEMNKELRGLLSHARLCEIRNPAECYGCRMAALRADAP